MEMDHGYEIVLADVSFPGHSLHSRVIRYDGIVISRLLEAILELPPIDHYAESQVALMSVVPGGPTIPVIWDTYRRSFPACDCKTSYRAGRAVRVKSASAGVVTGEEALYGNIILKKDVIEAD